MADKQYWREMDKARLYPPEQKVKMEAAALKSFKVRERKAKIAERKVKAKETVDNRKPKKKPTKKPPKKRRTAKKKIQKARTATRAFKNIFG